jgi:predicted dehydrogenase
MAKQTRGNDMRFGLIGCGGIGQWRAEAVAKSPSLRLAVVNDADAQRAVATASKYSAAVERDWRDLIRREDVDAVIVSTPPWLHAEMCIESLMAGKHVLCEKPLGRTAAECHDMVNAASRSGRFLATGFNYRFFPSVIKARELLDSGIIGELDHIRSYAGYSAAEHNHDWLRDSGLMGGGVLRDNGIHLIDLTRYFLGEVDEIAGFGSNAVWGLENSEDNGLAVLRSREGKLASLHASWTEWRGYRFQIELYGTRGCIRLWCFPILVHAVWSNQLGGKTRSKRFFFPKSHLMEHLFTYRWVGVQSFMKEMIAFRDAVEGGANPLATGHDGLRADEIAEGAERWATALAK